MNAEEALERWIRKIEADSGRPWWKITSAETAFLAGWDAREQKRIDASRAFVVEWERKQDELHGDYE